MQLNSYAMSLPLSVPSDNPLQWSDQQLVQACLAGDERAWSALIGRYKNLIYSFPRRYGAAPADAADVFQLVCTELFRALPQLRRQESVRGWIMTVAAHQSYQWKRRHAVRTIREGGELNPEAPEVAVLAHAPLMVLECAEREQQVREAIEQLPPRCRDLLRLLFFQDPPVPYGVIAGQMGLATGSVGFIRARCLKKLERTLIQSGIRP